MPPRAQPTLKSLNMKWLVALVLLDVVLVLPFVAPELAARAAAGGLAAKLVAPGLAPLVVLLLVNVLPSSAKFGLLYWKGRNGLPGASAFTRHGPTDPRIDMPALTKHVGPLPTDPVEQNATWYRLYRQVQDEPTVRDAHGSSLLYRDMAAMSVILAITVPALIYWTTGDLARTGLAFAIFAAQYALTAASGRAAGTRFVCNVLAEHSIRKVPAKSAAAPRKSRAKPPAP